MKECICRDTSSLGSGLTMVAYPSHSGLLCRLRKTIPQDTLKLSHLHGDEMQEGTHSRSQVIL